LAGLPACLAMHVYCVTHTHVALFITLGMHVRMLCASHQSLSQPHPRRSRCISVFFLVCCSSWSCLRCGGSIMQAKRWHDDGHTCSSEPHPIPSLHLHSIELCTQAAGYSLWGPSGHGDTCAGALHGLHSWGCCFCICFWPARQSKQTQHCNACKEQLRKSKRERGWPGHATLCSSDLADHGLRFRLRRLCIS
jgi:hypothetical protein